MVEIRALKDGELTHRSGRPVKAGEVVRLHPQDASQLVASGAAHYTVRVQALKDGVTFENRVLAKGEEILMHDERAQELAGRGVVAILGAAESKGGKGKRT